MNILTRVLIFTAVAIFTEVNYVRSHDCNYIIPKLEEIVTGIQPDHHPIYSRFKRAAYSNIRINFYYMSDFLANPQYSAIVTQFLEPARNILQQTIKVISPTNGALTVNRDCVSGTLSLRYGITGCKYGCADTTTCLGIQVPNMFLKKCVSFDASGNAVYSGASGSGATNADIVILVTNQNCSSTVLAYAASCFQDTTDRPILGVMNLCPGMFQPNVRVKERTKTIVHELIHALGFSVDKFAFYRNPDGSPIVPRNAFGFPSLGTSSDNSYYLWNSNIIKTFSRNRASVGGQYTKTYYGLVLPNVLQAARDQFNCSTLDGVDLQDVGGSGSELSHFSEYAYFNELMTPQSNNGMDVLSTLTLAALKDSGWYDVDYTAAEYLFYGNSKGCVLPMQGCYTYMQTYASSGSIDPFCKVPVTYGKIFYCSQIRDFFEYCGVIQYQTVPLMFQYFTSLPGVSNPSQYAGASMYNDYCPTPLVNSNPSSMCTDTTNTGLTDTLNVVQSYYGSDSFCFTNDVVGANAISFYGASCQKYQMISSTTCSITVGGQAYQCPSATSYNITLQNGMKMSLSCPTTCFSPILPKPKAPIVTVAAVDVQTVAVDTVTVKTVTVNTTNIIFFHSNSIQTNTNFRYVSVISMVAAFRQILMM